MMKTATDEVAVLARIVGWAELHDPVRTVILTSSRAIPDGPVDTLSDYDIVLIGADTDDFAAKSEWIAGFGKPLLVVRDQVEQFGFTKRNCMVLYDDGTKIDYSIWPESGLARVAWSGRLPDELDVGYRVLLDKDGLARHLPPPTFTAHIPSRPTAAEHQSLIEEFWFCATYVAKYLWRRELMPAKTILDYEMTYLLTRRMLEWRIELDHDWSVRPGFFGRGLQRYLDEATWTELSATYSGAEWEAIWAALYRAIELFRRVAVGVGADLGYAYPHELDATMLSYLRRIERLP
jgi:aminoglycoside 6-adenylyltransferase